MQDDYDNNGMVTLADPMNRDFGGFDQLPMQNAGPDAAPFGGAAMIVSGPREITAKKVAVARNMAQILRELKTYCASFGDNYVYSWEVNDKRNRRKTTIEGGTIKLANDLIQLYGNCSVDLDVNETKTHLIFKAFFIDYERGTCVSRLFQQRKSQNTGMADADRQADIIFQIGQSKAIRNTVLNALASLSSYAIEEAKKGMIAKFNEPEGREKALSFIEKVRERFAIDIKRIEALVGRRERDWTARDLARVWTECRAIADGMASPADVYPSEADAAEILEDKQEASEAGKRKAEEKAESKPKPAAKKAETKPAAKVEKPAESAGEIPAFLDRREKKAEPTPESAADEESASEDVLDELTMALVECEDEDALDRLLDDNEARISALPRAARDTFEDRATNRRKSLTAKPAPKREEAPPAEDDGDWAFDA